MTTHVSEERLEVLARDQREQASQVEDAHIADCEVCMKKFVDLVRQHERLLQNRILVKAKIP
jgi:hypothetical protein